ncbi:hypothetical protein EDS67_22080 [candidate division KSB1 bacterium]|nr:MAG: hypothetical protein EDS67_22080 [candidate division KSB1 bacterium]MBC6951218.1 hypothetical protein [candidate division KSB1 bacterium]MCE7944301.1 hypothetical protein [Chlorobi bacterium CHB1]MDL1878400.1 hypothetical protein [Cytophagia bacterium CHB2]
MKSKHRSSNGRFLPGNSGGPGRPSKPFRKAYWDATSEEVTVNDWRAIVRQAKVDALGYEMQGKKRETIKDSTPQTRHQARMFLALYLLGRPAQVTWVLESEVAFGEAAEMLRLKAQEIGVEVEGDPALQAIIQSLEQQAGTARERRLAKISSNGHTRRRPVS